MTALTTSRSTLERSADHRTFPVKASTLIYQGSLVAFDNNDVAVRMSTATTLKGVGLASELADYSSGVEGGISITVGAGTYRFVNSSAANQIGTIDIGENCNGVDDQTVAKTDGTGTRSIADIIFDVDAQSVWVKFS